jgi:hypothetical protein
MSMQATGHTIAAHRPALSPTDLSIPRSKGLVVAFWIVTALFCLQIGFTAYAQLSLPQVAAMFTHLGFPDYFRVELAWAKLLGVVAAACTGASATQGVGPRWLRHHPRVGACGSLLDGRWSGSVELGGGDRRALGGLVLLMAPRAGRAGPRVTAR